MGANTSMRMKQCQAPGLANALNARHGAIRRMSLALGMAMLAALMCLAGGAPALAATSGASAHAMMRDRLSSDRPSQAEAYARIAVVRVLTYYYGKVNDLAPIPVKDPCAADGVLIGTTGTNLNSYNYVLTATQAVNSVLPCQGVQAYFQQLYGSASSWGITQIQVVLDAAYTGVGSSQLGSIVYNISPSQVNTVGSASGPRLIALALSPTQGMPTHDLPVLSLPQPSDRPANPGDALVLDLTAHDGQPLGRDSLLTSEVSATLYPASFPAVQVGKPQPLQPTATPANNNSTGGTPLPTTPATAAPTPTTLSTQLALGAPEIDGNGRLIGMIGADAAGNHILISTKELKQDVGAISGASGPLMSQWQQGISDFYANPPNFSAANGIFSQLQKSYPDFGGVAVFVTATSQQTTSIPPMTVPPTQTPVQQPTIIPTSSGISKSTLLIIGVIAGLVILALIVVGVVIQRRSAKAEREREAARLARMKEEEGLDLLPEDSTLDELIDEPVNPQGHGALPPGRMPFPPEPQEAPIRPRGMSQGMARDALTQGIDDGRDGRDGYGAGARTGSPSQGPRSVPPMDGQRGMSQGFARDALADGAASRVGAPTSRPSGRPAPMNPNGARDLNEETPTAILSGAAHEPVAPRKGVTLVATAAGMTDPGVKRASEPNQDNILAVQGVRLAAGRPQPYGLFIVADGMGGHLNGQEASRLTIDIVSRTVMQPLATSLPLDDATLGSLLTEGVTKANAELQERNRANKSDMGTTITAALVVDDRAYIINVGDSRTYVLNPDAGLQQITTDHSVVASLVTAGVIKPEDIYTHPRRNQIYRSLGGEDEAVEVDSFSTTLQAGDKLLLCSDGLWEMVHDPQIANILRGTADPKRAVELLVREANANGGEDNIGVIVARLLEAAPDQLQPGMRIIAAPQGAHGAQGAEAQQPR